MSPSAVVNSSVAFDNFALKKLLEEQRHIEHKQRTARAEMYARIVMHFRRGMSRVSLERNWGREAVAGALDGVASKEPAVVGFTEVEIARESALKKRRMAAR